MTINTKVFSAYNIRKTQSLNSSIRAVTRANKMKNLTAKIRMTELNLINF